MFDLPARSFCDANPTYRNDYAELLQIDPTAVFPVVACARCAFVFAALLPDEEFLATLYDRVIAADAGFAESTGLVWEAHLLLIGSMLLDELARSSLPRPIRVLDFGCGYGSLVKAIDGPEVSAVGFETSPRRVQYIRDLGLHVVENLDQVRREAPFGAIVLSDVLEHVPAPIETLETLHDLLAPLGLLLINVPNFNSQMCAGVQVTINKGLAPGKEVNPWEHLNYFSPASLRAMVRSQGFDVLEVRERSGFGLRPDLHGHPRVVNFIESLWRLARASVRLPAPTTTVLAQRPNCQ